MSAHAGGMAGFVGAWGVRGAARPRRAAACARRPAWRALAEPDGKFRYDPESDKDAFGRDPRKETEFWMAGAREVLDSEVVKDAVEGFAAEGGDGYTDEQRAYMEFVKSLDEKKDE